MSHTKYLNTSFFLKDFIEIIQYNGDIIKIHITFVWQSTFVKAEYIIKVMTSAMKDK
jgi:hypothetical protein